MKKKLIGLAIIAPLFLSACSFQEVWGNIKDKTLSLFGQKAKEEKESGTTPGGSTTPSDGSTTPTDGGQTPSGGTDTDTLKTASFDFTQISTTSGSSNGFNYATAKGSGASAPAYNSESKELRLYINNTITFTSSNKIKYIYFNANTCAHEKADGSFTVSAGNVSEASDGFSWQGDATSVTFTVSTGKQVHINSIEINNPDAGGSGGGSTTTEFPASEINTFLSSMGSTATVSSFSGSAKGYTFESEEEYAILDIEVEEGGETAAISAFASDLLATNKFEEDMLDIYGDMHYATTDKKVDVCAWDGNYAQTSAPGHVYVEFVEYVAPVSALSLSEINTFLTTEEFDFNLTQSEVDALNALSSKFKVTTGADSSGYGWYDILIQGSFASQINDIIKATVEAGGYSVETTEVGFTWTNDYSYSVTIASQNGMTMVEFY